MSAALTIVSRKLAAVKAAPKPTQAFTPAQLEKIEALARSIAKEELAAFKRWAAEAVAESDRKASNRLRGLKLTIAGQGRRGGCC